MCKCNDVADWGEYQDTHEPECEWYDGELCECEDAIPEHDQFAGTKCLRCKMPWRKLSHCWSGENAKRLQKMHEENMEIIREAAKPVIDDMWKNIYEVAKKNGLVK